MSNKAKNIAKRIAGSLLFKTAVIVAMTYALTTVLLAPFAFSLGAIGAKSSKDFVITDLYHTVADARDVRQLSRDIVVVDIKNCNREEIADVLNLVNLCEPRAVGVDVIFKDERFDDEPLIEAVSNTPGIVLAESVEQKGRTGRFDKGDCSYFTSALPDVQPGVVNYPTTEEGGAIRTFPMRFDVAGRQEPSFALALARKAVPELAARLEERGHDEEVISYPSVDFPVIAASEIFDRRDEIVGKVVILGAIGDLADMHMTPLDPKMAGVLVHAYSLQTILGDSYLEVAPAWVESLIALLIAAAFIMLNLTVPVGIKGLLLRVLQLAALYAVVQTGFWFFVERGLIVDFSKSFLMLTFALFSCDIWFGLCYCANWIAARWRRRRNGDNIPAYR